MDLSSILGILVGFGMIIVGYILEKGQVSALFLLSPAVIVFGGTIGAVMLSYSMNEVKRLPMAFLEAFTSPKRKTDKIIEFLVSMAEAARRDGVLCLEDMIRADENKDLVDPYIEHGIMMVVDGSQAEEIRDALENELSVYEQKKKLIASMFESAGGFSPTMGIIGTVMGLVQVLSHMSAPEELAHSIAVAFIATLYGVCFANLVYLPIAAKLKLKIKYNRMEKDMIIDGICAIRNGDNPRILRERISVYLDSTKKKSSANADVK